MSQSRVFALFVGIDKYRPPVPPLDGCVNDMRAMLQFIEQRTSETGTPLFKEVLENEQATRLNIVRKFEEHLGQAGAGDIVFFYYSGHGSQEKAHELFWPIEEDRKNETLVCYDSRLPDGMDLADKELATLIDVVTRSQAQMLVVLDCCNSGSGTRSTTTKIRNVQPGSDRVRSLESYILPRNLNTDRSVMAVSPAPDTVVPNPRHVTLSAAQSFQEAKETTLGGSPRGVFTYSLLEVLNSAVGSLSYNDVLRRVRSLVTQRTYEQVPQLYAQAPEDVDLVFLGGATARQVNYYPLIHDPAQGWIVEAGATQGIPVEAIGNGSFYVYAGDASERELSDVTMALGSVKIMDVSTNRSVVAAEGGLFLHTAQAYRCRIKQLPLPRTRVCLRGDDAGVRALQNAMQQDHEAQIFLEQVKDVKDCEYNLLAQDQEYRITRKADRDDQPLVEQIRGYDLASAARAVDQMIHIARWERLVELVNGGSCLPANSIRIDLMDPVQNQVVPSPPGEGEARGQESRGAEHRFSYRKADGPDKRPRFRVRLTNTSGQRLFCGLLHLSSQFEANPEFLLNAGIWLEPGAEAWVLGGKALRGEVNDALYAFGRKEVRERFKVIYSTTEFDARAMRLPALNMPRTRSAAATNSRSLFAEAGQEGAAADWNTADLSLVIRRED
jgi:hypothetical protein